MEASLEEYVENMVMVFREVKRVMRHDAVMFLNLGDSYVGGGRGGNAPEKHHDHSKGIKVGMTGLKPKDLMGVPWRVAFALQADGWWLRSDIIWSKKNPMPESVTDRPTKSHEYLFLLTKSARYYYDADAVREAHKEPWRSTGRLENRGTKDIDSGINQGFGLAGVTPREYNPSGRNRRTVWHIATAPYSGAHFATYPPALVEPCIKAGTSERGVCPECGAPWERVVDRSKQTGDLRWSKKGGLHRADAPGAETSPTSCFRTGSVAIPETLGWQPSCSHVSHDPISATVFDPFCGSGTTLQVARALGRNSIGLDLSLEYLHLARTRLSLDALDKWTHQGGLGTDGKGVAGLPLFEEL